MVINELCCETIQFRFNHIWMCASGSPQAPRLTSEWPQFLPQDPRSPHGIVAGECPLVNIQKVFSADGQQQWYSAIGMVKYGLQRLTMGNDEWCLIMNIIYIYIFLIMVISIIGYMWISLDVDPWSLGKQSTSCEPQVIHHPPEPLERHPLPSWQEAWGSPIAMATRKNWFKTWKMYEHISWITWTYSTRIYYNIMEIWIVEMIVDVNKWKIWIWVCTN